VPISIDLLEAESWYEPAAVETTTPQSLFERRWALSVLDRVMARLRAEYGAMGKADLFERLEALLTKDADARCEALAQEMGVSAGALRMSLHRLRRKYRHILREEIAETVSAPTEIDEEIRFLMSVL
jgi:RNA polymerase sigma-70 factor (ECF subfamily)